MNAVAGAAAVVFEEMGRGNFSFLILVVGIIQLLMMWWEKR